jgi:hypothetical protein
VHVCRHFRLMSETLFLAVHVLDRYMERTREMGRDRYQLIGVASMLVAAKYEEIFFPEINDLYDAFFLFLLLLLLLLLCYVTLLVPTL